MCLESVPCKKKKHIVLSLPKGFSEVVPRVCHFHFFGFVSFHSPALFPSRSTFILHARACTRACPTLLYVLCLQILYQLIFTKLLIVELSLACAYAHSLMERLRVPSPPFTHCRACVSRHKTNPAKAVQAALKRHRRSSTTPLPLSKWPHPLPHCHSSTALLPTEAVALRQQLKPQKPHQRN
jgi:hypothetical protein